MILAILSLHVARSLSLSLCSRGYIVWKKMLVEEFQDSCLMLDPLWHLNGMISAFLCNLSACCLLPSFCSRAYMVWKRMMFGEIPGWLFSARQSLVCKWDNWNYFWVSMLHETFHQVGWIIPGWLFSTRQSLICKWDDLSYFWVSMLQEAFHQVSDQEDIWFWRWWWLKNSKMAV